MEWKTYSIADDMGIRTILKEVLINDVNSCEMFIEGIDFSYDSMRRRI